MFTNILNIVTPYLGARPAPFNLKFPRFRLARLTPEGFIYLR